MPALQKDSDKASGFYGPGEPFDKRPLCLLQRKDCRGLEVRMSRFLITLIFSLSFFNGVAFAGDIKEPNVAGTFYPADPQELSSLIDGMLDDVKMPPHKAEILALIVPHAAYAFSGKVAAYGYKAIEGRKYKTVIIIAPAHYYAFKGVSVYPAGSFATPLGELEIDAEFSQRLLARDKDIYFEPAAFEKEHALEVQLPFLERALGKRERFKIVPILTGECDFATCQKLASLIKEAIAGRRDVLVVASTDMYHGYDYREAEVIDNLTLSYLKNLDGRAVYDGLAQNRLQLCGGMGVVTTLLLAESLGHNKLEVLKYSNSAVVTGRTKAGIWTVGYASCIIDAQEGENAMLNKSQRKRLLEIARSSIETYLKTGKRPELTDKDAGLLEKRGAFVTLHEEGELRGCIGNLIAGEPLYLTIRDMAIEAAVGDPRFAPVELAELPRIEIEISVLSPLEKISDPARIKLGTHGVLVRQGFHSGVFLPQVATETGWSKEEFLSNLCSHKAGLEPLAWKDKATEIYIFSAEIFSEKNY